MEEQRLLDNAVTELRFRYVQAMEQHGKTAEAASADAAKTEPSEEQTEGQTGS
jgi:hypothetical protein